MKTKMAIALILSILFSASAMADDIYRWTNPETGEILATTKLPPYPIKDKRFVGRLPSGDMIELIFDSNAPEVKALIEKRKIMEAEQAARKAEWVAREAEQKQTAGEKEKQQAAMKMEQEKKRDAQINSLKTGEGFKIGMSEIDLIALWGEPTKVNTSIRSTGVSKQMIYTDPCMILELGEECLYKSRIVYSENGVIISVHF